MGAVRLQQNRAGTIRRVVRVSGRFLCGLCRNLYDHPTDAHDCLSTCWQETLAMDPVVVKYERGCMLLRCLFCARDYDNRSAVLRCADECKRQKLRKAMAESKITGPEDLPANRRSVRKLRSVIVPVAPVKRKPKKAPRAIEAVSEIVEPIADELVTTADSNEKPVVVDHLATVQISDDSLATDKSKKKKPSEVYYRDQAKYVCTICHEKYFTKVEVSKCYDAHE